MSSEFKPFMLSSFTNFSLLLLGIDVTVLLQVIQQYSAFRGHFTALVSNKIITNESRQGFKSIFVILKCEIRLNLT